GERQTRDTGGAGTFRRATSTKPRRLSLRRTQAAYNPGRDGGVRMRLRHAAAIASFLIGSLAASLAIAAVQDSPPSAESLARDTLGPHDGWASFSGGTTGGAVATPDHVYTVTNRQELVAAFAAGSTPKIVFVSGTIDANVDGSNQPLPCSAYEVPAYS